MAALKVEGWFFVVYKLRSEIRFSVGMKIKLIMKLKETVSLRMALSKK